MREGPGERVTGLDRDAILWLNRLRRWLGCNMTESIIERATGNTESTSQTKMLKFHTHLTALELAVASIKAFPDLHLCDT